MLEFNEKIKRIRKIEGLTLQELAAKLDISYQTLSKYEKNKTEPPVSFIFKLTGEFPQYLNYLFDLEEEEQKQDTSKTEEIYNKQEEINTKQKEENNKQKEEIRDLKSKIDKVERTISNLINNNKNFPLA